MWIDEFSGHVFTAHADIRDAFPLVSLPAVISDAALQMIGVRAVTVMSQPSFNPITQNCTALSPQLVDGEWVQAWAVTDKGQADVEAAQQAAAIARREEIRDAIQALLDTECQKHDFDSINTACGWAGVMDDATALRAWGASCWAAATIIEQEVLAGTRTLPTVAEVMAAMPAYEG